VVARVREVEQGPQEQGEDEVITWGLDTSGYADTPASVSVVVKDWSTAAHTDVTSTVYSGTATVIGNVITLGPIGSLTANHKYRVEVQFTAGAGDPFEPYFYLNCRE